MQKLTIYFEANFRIANSLHVILDGKDIGIIDSGGSGTINISNDQHSLHFGYYVPAIGGNDVPITSEEISISSTYDSAPEILEYIYNVSIINNSNMSDAMKRSFSQMFLSKQERINMNAKATFSIYVRQSMQNTEAIEKKKKINYIYQKVESVMIKLTNQIINDIFEPLDFRELDALSEEEKNFSYMDRVFVPALVERTYASLVRLYLEGKIGMRLMFLILNQLRHVPYASDIMGDSFKHMDYLCTSGNSINSVLHGNAVDELKKLFESDFKIIYFNCLNQKEMRDKWNNRDEYDFTKREKMVCKSLFDVIVNVDKDENYFDDLKKSILNIAMIEREHSELNDLLKDIKKVFQETFGPIVIVNDEPIMGSTVDMIIADALYYSKINSIDTVNDDLRIFLDVICPEFDIQSEQYCILQEIFVWLNAYTQEKMVLEAMVNNGIPRTKEQEDRLTFLNTNKNNIVGFNLNGGQIQETKNKEIIKEKILCYDYQFMAMNDTDIFNFFNSLSMENKLYNNAIVIDEWTNSIEMQGIVWNEHDILSSIDEVIKKNFGERFEISIEECFASADVCMEEATAIVISEKDGLAMPWLSFLILGEQIILNHMNISIYTLFRPDRLDLSDNIYEQNQIIQKNVLSLKKKQNPKINNLIQIVINLVVKELENWVNSQQSQSIYE